MPSKTIRLTAAQALVRYVMNQRNEAGERFISGTWAIFGHGNVTGMGEALGSVISDFPTWRGHNEQSMAHIAIAYSKSLNRRRAMAVTSSIGPGATNMVTAAAVAHVNRLPVLFLPGDVFANRSPDPVLQQIEDFEDSTISANDCFRPVSRYYDCITRPEQLLRALPRAFAAMTDPANCGPATLSFCQDVQAEAYDYPLDFFTERVWHHRCPSPDSGELSRAISALKSAKSPLIISGGGTLYSGASEALMSFAKTHNIAVAETQAGKSSLPWDFPLNFGAIGVNGSSSANDLARKSDVILAVGTRLQDFTTGSWALFENPDCQIISLNISVHDSHKGILPLVSDAKVGLDSLSSALGSHEFSAPPSSLRQTWLDAVDAVTAPPESADSNTLPSDSQVIGAVQRATNSDTIILGAAGGLPGELYKLWKSDNINGYHMEYGYSCMGYEIAGGLGAKMACPDREVVVMVGDGSYMMMNSELATSITLGHKIIVVLLDNRGFGCIDRLQRSAGQDSFNNLLDTTIHQTPSQIDFASHAQSMGANSCKVANIGELESAISDARNSDISSVIVIDTDPAISTDAGGYWWDVAVAEISQNKSVMNARKAYDKFVSKVR